MCLWVWMLDKLKETVFSYYDAEEHKGIFLSSFSAKKTLIWSHGVVRTDKPVREVLEQLYTQYIEPQLKEVDFVVIDMVTDLIEMVEPAEVLTKSPEERWFVVTSLQWDASGVILPAMEWVTDAKSALFYLKKKYDIEGTVDVAVFRTQRVLLGK